MPIEQKHVLDGLWVGLGGRLKHRLYCTWNVGKVNLPGEKGLDRDFIRRIQGDAVGASAYGCFVGQAEAGKTLKIGCLEVEMAEFRHIESQAVSLLGVDPIRIGHRIE